MRKLVFCTVLLTLPLLADETSTLRQRLEAESLRKAFFAKQAQALASQVQSQNFLLQANQQAVEADKLGRDAQAKIDALKAVCKAPDTWQEESLDCVKPAEAPKPVEKK